MGGSMAEPKLLDQYRERLRVKHYSLRTEDAYLHWVRRFIYFHGKRHPREMGGPEVEAFLSHLATEGRGQNKTSLDRTGWKVRKYPAAAWVQVTGGAGSQNGNSGLDLSFQ
jgi:hypothetical protein